MTDLWDDDPDVCCAYFQLGACSHTESRYEDEMHEMMGDGTPRSFDPPAKADEPF